MSLPPGAAGKGEVRRLALARRKAAQAAGGEAAAEAATAALLAALAATEGPVAGYLPIRSEIDPTAAMTALAPSRIVAVPVVEAVDHPLRFRNWRPLAALAEGPLGTRHPEGGDWVVPRVVIVPCLAFDRAGYRLGYGGGFYDRTLEALRARGPVRAVGFAFAAQEMPEVPVEPTDQPLDLVVTEAGILHPGR